MPILSSPLDYVPNVFLVSDIVGSNSRFVPDPNFEYGFCAGSCLLKSRFVPDLSFEFGVCAGSCLLKSVLCRISVLKFGFVTDQVF